MVRTASEAAEVAEGDTANDPGMCLQQTRIWCDVAAYYGDASTAWRYATGRRPGDRHPPRGAPVYWVGGSHGYGHVALALGNGKIRSTDAGGSGRVATVDLGWVETHWGLPYAGWASSINNVTIPGLEEEGDDMPSPKDWTDKDWAALDAHVQAAVWKYKQEVTHPDGTKDERYTKQLLREIWQRVAK